MSSCHATATASAGGNTDSEHLFAEFHFKMKLLAVTWNKIGGCLVKTNLCTYVEVSHASASGDAMKAKQSKDWRSKLVRGPRRLRVEGAPCGGCLDADKTTWWELTRRTAGAPRSRART